MMAENSKIEWTDATWNPLAGCTKVSPGCAHCYAEIMARRLKAIGNINYQGVVDEKGRWSGQIALIPSVLQKPLHWKRSRMIFVDSMSDLFHPTVPSGWIGQVFEVMLKANWHTFQVLTKRPERMAEILNGWEAWIDADREGRNKHIWLGTSVESQKEADIRVPHLLRVRAMVRFVSCEPMLGPIALDGGLNYDRKTYPCDDEIRWGHGGGLEGWNSLTGEYRYYRESDGEPCIDWLSQTIDWVICGGESGPEARPMNPDWARSLREQCLEAGVPFFFKQWGEWMPRSHMWYAGLKEDMTFKKKPVQFGNEMMVPVGKHRSGNFLDGLEWQDFPILNAIDF